MARGLNEIESAYFLSGETPRGFNITHIKAPRLQFSLLLSVYFFFPLALPDGDIRQTYQRLVFITFINIICPGYSERFYFIYVDRGSVKVGRAPSVCRENAEVEAEIHGPSMTASLERGCDSPTAIVLVL
ncbi:hypothetical protein ABZX51_004375 [Aspergillus tubingensis]